MIGSILLGGFCLMHLNPRPYRATASSSDLYCNEHNYKEFIGRDTPFFNNFEQEGCYFKDMNLEREDFAKANLKWARILGTNLQNANLSEADLIGSFIDKDSNLEDANLQEANLSRADINGNLSGADLSGAKFHLAVFGPSANLRGVNLKDANLRFAFYLKKANTSEAIYNSNTKFPFNFNPNENGMILNE